MVLECQEQRRCAIVVCCIPICTCCHELLDTLWGRAKQTGIVQRCHSVVISQLYIRSTFDQSLDSIYVPSIAGAKQGCPPKLKLSIHIYPLLGQKLRNTSHMVCGCCREELLLEIIARVRRPLSSDPFLLLYRGRHIVLPALPCPRQRAKRQGGNPFRPSSLLPFPRLSLLGPRLNGHLSWHLWSMPLSIRQVGQSPRCSAVLRRMRARATIEEPAPSSRQI
mmetsp:Transcript_10405/g.29639  ORF Transcript_10405/g.29639 Transcript_10405/m.29639 type:complete len:222 (-) Transcript_10405:193-858(-)